MNNSVKDILKKGSLITPMAGLLLAMTSSIIAKRPLNHNDFDSWQRARVNAVHPTGLWSAYSVEPQEGDAILTLRNNRKAKEINIERGYHPAFTSDGKWAVVLIKPPFADTRLAKIENKKDFDLPRDSMAIVELATGKINKIPNVINFKVGEEGGDFIAYQSCDTLHILPADLKDKEAGRPLIIQSLTSPTKKIVKWVKDYDFSKDGSKLSLNLKKRENDSIATDGVAIINLPDTSLLLLDRDKKFYTLPVFNEKGTAMAYTSSNDSTDSGTIHAKLHYADLTRNANQTPDIETHDLFFTSRSPVNPLPAYSDDPDEQARLDKERQSMIESTQGDILQINQYSIPIFSKSGRFLIIGVAPVIAPDDTTLVDFEKASLDIWRWDSPYTPPQESANLKEIREKTLPVIFNISDGMSYRIPSMNMLTEIEPGFKWDSEWILIHDPSKKIISRQWNYLAPEELAIYNVITGKTTPIGEALREGSVLSPDGRFVVTFSDRNYKAYNISTGEWKDISSKVPYPLWDEEDDHPMQKESYGIAGWGDGDNRVLIYDRFDIWSLDLTGKEEPINITNNEGRRSNRSFKYLQLDKDKPMIGKGEQMILEVIDLTDMRRGLATLSYGRPAAPNIKILDKYQISQLKKARDAEFYIWAQGNFETMPDLRASNSTDFSKGEKLTSINPWLNDISWGHAELVEWNAYDGTPAKGVLYIPEDFDPSGSYPLLSVFYERGAEDLYRHYTMEPSWSWVNYPFYVSRGYMVFVPDIYYTAGLPGECAYNYVCSGVEELCRRYTAIDKNRLGIDGQSWGGYQTAYLITRTNMFACAGSGAPVANMTSAYGGIRWESGDSRQAQYEMGQSRIGKTLWEAPELYLANSPVFNADRVNTPLLIMHNDADGAVPWYQGIELFMALRRLQKPVWMLQYNGEAHNIKQRRNRKDITIRLQQFFDHYLKGEPMPRWMKEGISPLRKGQDYGY